MKSGHAPLLLPRRGRYRDVGADGLSLSAPAAPPILGCDFSGRTRTQPKVGQVPIPSPSVGRKANLVDRLIHFPAKAGCKTSYTWSEKKGKPHAVYFIRSKNWANWGVFCLSLTFMDLSVSQPGTGNGACPTKTVLKNFTFGYYFHEVERRES